MTDFFNSLLDKVDLIIVALVLVSGFFQARYFKGFNLVKDPSYDSALKTLALSAVVSVIYIYLLKDPNKADNWAKYFYSYFGATSLYELLIDPFRNWIMKKIGSDKP